GAGMTILVARTGGSTGAITATITAGDGTATSGLDYTPPVATVTFGDGDVGPHAITVPIVDDRAGETDETVTLRLSSPGECATGGAASSAVLTIVDDDFADQEPTYTVGGTVTGLEGTGLVLREGSTGAETMPGNGSFAFGYAFASGASYDVRVATQPANPAQICTIANASGTIATADVTELTVSCVTPSPGGALDPGFGSGGLVTGDPSGGAHALALQD